MAEMTLPDAIIAVQKMRRQMNTYSPGDMLGLVAKRERRQDRGRNCTFVIDYYSSYDPQPQPITSISHLDLPCVTLALQLQGAPHHQQVSRPA